MLMSYLHFIFQRQPLLFITILVILTHAAQQIIFLQNKLFLWTEFISIIIKEALSILNDICKSLLFFILWSLLDKVGSQSQEQQNVAIKELNARLSYMGYCIFYLWDRNCLRRRLCKGKNVCRTVVSL